MAESDWDTVTVLRKKGPTAAQAKSKQVSVNISNSFPLVRHLFYPLRGYSIRCDSTIINNEVDCDQKVKVTP